MLTEYSTAGCDEQHFSARALASEVAAKLGNAMLSVVTGFFGDSSRTAAPASKASGKLGDQEINVTDLNTEYELTDPRRHIVSITASPDERNLLASDAFGRVMLFDVVTGTFVKIWKGYRDAQVGWAVAEEAGLPDDTAASTPGGGAAVTEGSRKCSFAIIHAPRRGLVEIWVPWFGHRVAAFNVGLGCTLISSRSPRYARTRGASVLFFICSASILPWSSLTIFTICIFPAIHGTDC